MRSEQDVKEMLERFNKEVAWSTDAVCISDALEWVLGDSVDSELTEYLTEK
jgi:hypothetical protein